MKRFALLSLAAVMFSIGGMAQENVSRLSLGFGCLYRNALDLTLSYEHVGRYHNAWKFFADGNLVYSKLATFLLICITCIGTRNKKHIEFNARRQVLYPLIAGVGFTVLESLQKGKKAGDRACERAGFRGQRTGQSLKSRSIRIEESDTIIRHHPMSFLL